MPQVTVANALNPAEAGLICSRLEAAGFHPFLPDKNTARSMEGCSPAVGGIHIHVPETEAADAREFLTHPAE